MSPIWLCWRTTRMWSKGRARNSSGVIGRARTNLPTRRKSPRFPERSMVFTRPTCSPLFFLGPFPNAHEDVEIALVARAGNATALDGRLHVAARLVRVRARIVAARPFDVAQV